MEFINYLKTRPYSITYIIQRHFGVTQYSEIIKFWLWKSAFVYNTYYFQEADVFPWEILGSRGYWCRTWPSPSPTGPAQDRWQGSQGSLRGTSPVVPMYLWLADTLHQSTTRGWENKIWMQQNTPNGEKGKGESITIMILHKQHVSQYFVTLLHISLEYIVLILYENMMIQPPFEKNKMAACCCFLFLKSYIFDSSTT